MNNLWILTEESPREVNIGKIIGLVDPEVNTKDLKIKPRFKDNMFSYIYDVENITSTKFENIYIKIVSGYSSFYDFLVFLQEDQPQVKNPEKNNLICAIEETKTNDSESRNTGIYQRASKFVYINLFYKDIDKYMMYSYDSNFNKKKTPSDTNIFGTNMLLTIGTKFIGKNMTHNFKKFESVEEVIEFKDAMASPPQTNVPIELKKYSDRIEISGRLSKPSDKGNIGHDPNIGALSIISKTLRELGWEKDIFITKHGVNQDYINRSRGNKFLYIAQLLNIKMKGINLPKFNYPKKYWRYEKKKEKVTSIFLHVLAEYNDIRAIYENHGGCERGYFKTIDNLNITLPKKAQSGDNLLIPDLILHIKNKNKILLIEAKKYKYMESGIEELKGYNDIEDEFIKEHYPDCEIERWVTTSGDHLSQIPHEKVLLHINEDGQIFVNDKADIKIKEMF